METFRVTKNKYDWVVVHNEIQYDLTRDRKEAVAGARRRAKAVLDSGGEAEILVINTVGMWDKLDVSGTDSETTFSSG